MNNLDKLIAEANAMRPHTIDGSNDTYGKLSFEDAEYSISFNFPMGELAAAEALAAKFPKYCKAKISGVNGNNIESYRTVNFDVSLATNKVTGDVNETAVKRRNKVLAIIKSLGL